MNCERYQNEIEDYLYGELTVRRAAEMRAHLAECSACASACDQIEHENQVFSRFYEETQIEPTGEMWEAIRARIMAEPRRVVEARSGLGSALSWLLKPAVLRQAGFALLLIVLSVAATIYFTRRGGDNPENIAGRDKKVTTSPTPQQSVTPAPIATPTTDLAGTNPGPAATEAPTRPAHSDAARSKKENQPPARPLSEQELIYQQIARAEREYKSAIRLLDGAIAKRRDSLDPAVMREYTNSLAMIDNSIANSRRALRERPDDISAGQFLLAAYAKKVELMQDIAMR